MNNSIVNEHNYYITYDLLLEKGFLLLTELNRLIDTKNATVAQIKANFENLNLYTYDDVLTREERKYVEYGNKPSCIRPLNPVFDKWRQEAEHRLPKNGHIVTNQRSIINGSIKP